MRRYMNLFALVKKALHKLAFFTADVRFNLQRMREANLQFKLDHNGVVNLIAVS